MSAVEWSQLDQDLDQEFLADDEATALDLFERGMAELKETAEGQVLVVYLSDDGHDESEVRMMPRPGSILSRANGDRVLAQQKVERYLARRKLIVKQLAEDTQALKQRIERAQSLLTEKENKARRILDSIDYFLIEYREEAYVGVEGTIKFEGGELRRDKNRDHIEWDEPRAVRWALAQDNPEELLTVRKSEIKAHVGRRGQNYVDENGEVVDFVRDVPAPEPYKLWVKQ